MGETGGLERGPLIGPGQEQDRSGGQAQGPGSRGELEQGDSQAGLQEGGEGAEPGPDREVSADEGGHRERCPSGLPALSGHCHEEQDRGQDRGQHHPRHHRHPHEEEAEQRGGRAGGRAHRHIHRHRRGHAGRAGDAHDVGPGENRDQGQRRDDRQPVLRSRCASERWHAPRTCRDGQSESCRAWRSSQRWCRRFRRPRRIRPWDTQCALPCRHLRHCP